MKFQSFLNFTKKIIEIIKMFLHVWFFTCCSHPFSFRTSLFRERDLMFDYIPTLIIFKHVNFGKNIWINTSKKRKKKHTHIKISSRDEVVTRLFFFFSSLSFWQGWIYPGMKRQNVRTSILLTCKMCFGKSKLIYNLVDINKII